LILENGLDFVLGGEEDPATGRGANLRGIQYFIFGDEFLKRLDFENLCEF